MTLRSISTIKILDLLCEGPIEGFADPIDSDGLSSSVLLNDNPIKIAGQETFDQGDVDVILRTGSTNQQVLRQFQTARKTEIVTIDQEVGSNYSETLDANNEVKERDYGAGQILQKITATDIDKFKVIFTIPALFSQAVEGIANGQLFSAKIRFKIFVKEGKESFVERFEKTIEGISTTNYQIITPEIELEGDGPYIIKIRKYVSSENDYSIRKQDLKDLSENFSFQGKRGNRLICNSFQLLSSSTETYKDTACVGLEFSSEAFPQLPSRSYLIKGKKVRIFSNATPRNDGSLRFSGEFDGNFLQTTDDDTGKTSDVLAWTTCPVCIFIDMLTNTRYGAGDFVSVENISLADLYPIARYCNQLVDTPDGSEPRFAINTIINTQTTAYKLLQYIASVFRGMTFWASNTVNVGADHGNLDGTDIDPVHLYTNSNVIDGVFSYSGTSVKTRSTRIRVNYNDPNNKYKIDQVVVEDQSLINKFGIQEKEIVAYGCTSKYQAQRQGQYLLKAEELDVEVLTFSTGLDGLFVFPSQVFAVADLMRAGQRISGRVSSASTTVITTDQTVQLPNGANKKLTCILSDGSLETKDISTSSSTTITVSSAFSSAPLAQSVYAISTDAVQKQKFRCTSVIDNNDGTYTITATQHNDSIYAAADDTTGTTNLIQDDRLISTFDNNPEKPTDLVVSFSDVKINNNTVNRALFQWSRGTNGAAIKFDIELDINGKNKVSLNNYTQTTYEIDNLLVGALLKFKVCAVGFEPDKKSGFRTLNITVPAIATSSSTGTLDPTDILPPDPENPTIQATTKNEAIIKWTIPSDFTGNKNELVAIIRHSQLTDGSAIWPETTALREVQANTDSLILPLMNGTYMIKFKDTNENKSANAKSVIIDLPDDLPKLLHTQVREDTTSPPFQGQRDNIFFSDEYNALALETDDLIDDKVDFEEGYLQNIDFGGTLLPTGTYFFKDKVDLGAVFTVEIKRHLQTRGLYPNNTIDLHFTNIDEWTDFDGALPDETNCVLSFRKSNTAPADDEVADENDEFILLEDDNKFAQEDSQSYGPFIPLENGRFTGRVFQFKADLTAQFADQTPLIDELGYTMQFENRTESDSTTSGTGAKVITFNKAFVQPPKIGITASNMATGDYYVISSESRTGFTITFFNSSNAAIDRTFSYQANGFGAEET